MMNPLLACPLGGTTINDYLPDEILMHVFSFQAENSLGAAACVCRRWKRLATDEALWKHLIQTHMPYLPKGGGELTWREHYLRNYKGAFLRNLKCREKLFYAAWGKTLAVWRKQRLTDRCFIGYTPSTHAATIQSFELRVIGIHPIMITGASDGEIKIWKRHDSPFHLQDSQTLYGHASAVSVIKGVSSDFFSGDECGNLCFWRCQHQYISHSLAAKVKAHADKITCMEIDYKTTSPHLFTASRDGTIREWLSKRSGLECLGEIDAHASPVTALCLFSLNRHLLSASLDGTVKIWQHDGDFKLRNLAIIRPGNAAITALEYIPEASMIATTDSDCFLRLGKINAVTGEYLPIATFPISGAKHVFSLKYIPASSIERHSRILVVTDTAIQTLELNTGFSRGLAWKLQPIHHPLHQEADGEVTIYRFQLKDTHWD